MKHLKREAAMGPRSGLTVWSRGGLAAVDGDDLAGDERRLAGSREHDGVGDLFRPASALQRYAGDEASLAVGSAGEAVQHRGIDRARRARVAAAAERRRLQRRRLGQTFDRMLARGI